MSKLKELVDQKDLRIFVYATGAGAGIQSAIWHTLGCSSFFVGAEFPYAPSESSRALGYTPTSFVSEEMAIDLAMAAYVRAYEFGKKSVGIGLTASVASSRAHRGDHRIIVSGCSDDGVLTAYMTLPKGVGDEARALDGKIADSLAIKILLHAAGQNYVLPKETHCDVPVMVADTNSQAFFSLEARPYFTSSGQRKSFTVEDRQNSVFYPGNFDPLHEGHIGAAEATLDYIANKIGKRKKVIFTTTTNPPHKSPLSSPEVLQRVALMKGHNFLVTKGDARYLDKARLFPNSSFILGADALIRMLDPKWGVPTQDLLDELTNLKTTYYVLGRLVEGKFITLHDIEDQYPILYKYQHLFEPVSGRWDVSSTEKRAALNQV